MFSQARRVEPNFQVPRRQTMNLKRIMTQLKTPDTITTDLLKPSTHVTSVCACTEHGCQKTTRSPSVSRPTATIPSTSQPYGAEERELLRETGGPATLRTLTARPSLRTLSTMTKILKSMIWTPIRKKTHSHAHKTLTLGQRTVLVQSISGGGLCFLIDRAAGLNRMAISG